MHDDGGDGRPVQPNQAVLQPVLAHPGLRRLHRRGTVRWAGVAVTSTSGSPGLTDAEGGSGWDREGAATGAGTSRPATPAPARDCTTVSSGCPIN